MSSDRTIPPVPRSRLQEATMRCFQGEELIARLFQALGYQVDREIVISGARIDIVAYKDGTLTLVEVISTKTPPLA